jgi:apolipoprotein N-acyltransferase
VENGVPAAKADTAWDSAIIDSDGRIRARHVSTVGDDAVLIANVRLGSGPTFYTRTGDLVGWASVVAAAIWALIVLRAVRRTRGTQAGHTLKRLPSVGPSPAGRVR